MIRINLLPVRTFKRKENVRRQVSIFLLTVLFLIGVMGFVYANTLGNFTEFDTEKKELAEQEKELQKKVKEVKQLQKEEEELQDKLRIIANLEKRRRGPVRVLDELSNRIPPQKAWLINIEQNEKRLTLKGVAMDLDTVALFMSNLEESEFFRNVELDRTSQEIKNELRLKNFIVKCEIFLKEEEKPAED